MARLKDIAEASGVSIRTVGRALKGAGYVHKDVRERVLASAKELDYRPHRLARSLRTGRSHEVLVLAGGIGGQRDELHIAKIAGMERALRAGDMALGLLFGLEDQARRQNRDLLDELISRRPGGIALFPGDGPQAKPAARRLEVGGVPYIFLDHPDRDVDAVRHDRQQGVHEAVTYLASRGRKRIAYVGVIDERSRLDGYERTMRELGRPPIIVPMPKPTWEDGRKAASAVAALDPRPDAIMGYSDIVALGILAGLHELGIKIPAEIAVIGFDDRMAASLSFPPLTTVQQDNDALGVAAAEVLLAKVRGDPPPAGGWSRLLPTRLIVRAST
ncbi:MAG: LacI family DNA-binding transcriptional regulator [Planctomycetes bacterium]|nr:LacI family DNA-binding transcriptional regulator [Planctomycetota bacterium]